MKWLFGFLLVLSIALLVFMQWGGELTGASKNGQMLAALNPEKIKLLDMPASMRVTDSAVPPVQSVAAVSAPAATVPVAIGMPPASAPAAVSAPSPVPARQETIVAAKAAESGVAVPAPLRKSPLESKAEGKAAGKSCVEWGEFSGTDYARATKALATFDFGDRLAQRTAEYASGYWVYIPPLKNKAAVNRKIAQLKTFGVEDYFVMQEPKGTHMISLGVFKTQEAAKNYLASLQKKGVETAKIGERKRMLKFTVFVIKQVDAETLARLSALQKDFRGSELKSLPCSN